MIFTHTLPTRPLRISLLLLILFSPMQAALAHTIRPAVITLTWLEEEQFTLTLRTNLEQWIAGVSAQHQDTDDSPTATQYNQLRQLSAQQLGGKLNDYLPNLLGSLTAQFDGNPVTLSLTGSEIPEVGNIELARDTTLYLHGRGPRFSERFQLTLAPEYGAYVLRIPSPSSNVVASYWLQDGGPTPPLVPWGRVESPSMWEVATTYLQLGFTHIVPLGVDHILFVLGIFLLSLRLGPLLWQVSAFTLAHTITLGLSMAGWMALSPAIVEPLIALSIIYVAIENVITPTLHPWRVVIVFLFGLLHGMGFAGVLTEIGLPAHSFWQALISFNIGVELGQLSVILIATLLLTLPFGRSPYYRQRFVVPLSLLIALIGGYWLVERIGG